LEDAAMATATLDLTWTDPATVASSLSKKVLQYGDIIERTVKAAKKPGFSGETGWAELELLLNLEKFERVGNDKARMGWPVYRELLTKWATTTDFWSHFHRISEAGNCVFLELTEHNTPQGGSESVVNSLSLYEFDAAGKLIHLDIYLQHD
jgi:hypothetical protein